MLYDNAQLSLVYLHAWQVTKSDRFRTICRAVLDELRNEMAHPLGGFFSSQDADSEGVEGKFFTWTWDELVSSVGEPVARSLGASPTGNWDGPPGTEGTNVLRRPPLAGIADMYGLDLATLERDRERATEDLMSLRSRRVRPTIDDKIISGWNGLAIRAFSEAARAFEDGEYLDVAQRASAFVWTGSRRSDGRLMRSWRDDRVSVEAFADDHALLASAYLSLYEASGDTVWFRRARDLSDDLLRLFHDEEGGGFFQVGADADRLITRPKDLQDNATPSGNSAGAEALMRLAMFTGDTRYERAALGALGIIAGAAKRAPGAFGHALSAMDLTIGPRKEIAVVGDPSDPRTTALVNVALRTYRPHVVVARGDGSDVEDEANVDVPLLRGRRTVGDTPAAYVCERFSCRAPVTDPVELERSLSSVERP
jgi:hypothetical protein